MSGPGPSNTTRFVSFSEVRFGEGSWELTNVPDLLGGYVSYSVTFEETAPVTIIRSDGKVLSFEANSQYTIGIRNNVISFTSFPGDPSDGPFQ